MPTPIERVRERLTKCICKPDEPTDPNCPVHDGNLGTPDGPY